MNKFKAGDVVKIKDNVTAENMESVSLESFFWEDYPDGVFVVNSVGKSKNGKYKYWVETENCWWNVPEDFVELYVDETALLKERVLLLEERITYLESVLGAIGDKAHYASTGPTVVDEYWEIRKMAYDAYIGEYHHETSSSN